jgi:hypothetical protein
MTVEDKPMPRGIAVVVGDIPVLEDQEKWTVRRAILIQFATDEECKEAIARRGLTFGLFEDETESENPEKIT